VAANPPASQGLIPHRPDLPWEACWGAVELPAQTDCESPEDAEDSSGRWRSKTRTGHPVTSLSAAPSRPRYGAVLVRCGIGTAQAL